MALRLRTTGQDPNSLVPPEYTSEASPYVLEVGRAVANKRDGRYPLILPQHVAGHALVTTTAVSLPGSRTTPTRWDPVQTAMRRASLRQPARSNGVAGIASGASSRSRRRH